MEESQIKRLKAASEQFYLGIGNDGNIGHKSMSDKEFDELRKQYESEYGGICDLIDWPTDLTLETINDPKVDKIVVEDNNLRRQIEEDISSEDDYYLNLKYDGGAIAIRYDENGDLIMVQSTPFNNVGIVRTEQFWDLVPHHIDPELKIRLIRGEVLVDADVYGETARNKANGLINSCRSISEVYNEAFIRFYRLVYFDEDEYNYDRQKVDLMKIPTVVIFRSRLQKNGIYKECRDEVFKCAYRFKTKDIPISTIHKFPNEPAFQLDGVVVYTKWTYAYKFYYTESAVTLVNDIIWQRQSNGGWSAKLSLDAVELNGKLISACSTGGVPNMIYMGMGIGSKVEVILANLTIPKVINVLEKSNEFNYPKCGCGYQTDENSIFGSTVKCCNTHPCIDRMKIYFPQLIEILSDESWFPDGVDTVSDIIGKYPHWIMDLLFIDRFVAANRSTIDFDAPESKPSLIEFGNELINIINLFDDDHLNYDTIHDRLMNIFSKFYSFTDLQYELCSINCVSVFYILNKIKYKGSKDIKDISELMSDDQTFDNYMNSILN